MSFLVPRLTRHVIVCCAVASLVACKQKERPNRGDRTERPLDGMERFAAQSVSIETAIQAMQDRDVKKLKMLGVWVRNRDKTVLMTPDDLRSLDLAVACLEGQKTFEERSAELEEIESGKLKGPARALCLQEEE